MVTRRWMTRAILLGLVYVRAASAETPNTRQLDPEAKSPPAELWEIAWLAGAWHGEGLGGECDEVWLPASGGAMTGTFRLVKDGKLVFSEFMSIVPESGSLVLKVKHFNPDVTGWEEKNDTVDFRLVELKENEAYFGGLTFRRTAPDRLTIFLALKQKDGTLREEAFYLRRSTLDGTSRGTSSRMTPPALSGRTQTPAPEGWGVMPADFK